MSQLATSSSLTQMSIAVNVLTEVFTGSRRVDGISLKGTGNPRVAIFYDSNDVVLFYLTLTISTSFTQSWLADKGLKIKTNAPMVLTIVHSAEGF